LPSVESSLYEMGQVSPWSPHCYEISAVELTWIRSSDLQHYPMNLAIILRPANSISSKSGVTGRSFLVLTLVDDDTKSGEHGRSALSCPCRSRSSHAHLSTMSARSSGRSSPSASMAAYDRVAPTPGRCHVRAQDRTCQLDLACYESHRQGKYFSPSPAPPTGEDQG
jgi:hypothetical protein